MIRKRMSENELRRWGSSLRIRVLFNLHKRCLYYQITLQFAAAKGVD